MTWLLPSGRRSGSRPDLRTSDSRFEIVNGQLKLKAGYTLDFEATPTVSVNVTATDAGGLSLTRTLTVGVTNVNEAPTTVSFANATTTLADTVFSTVPGAPVFVGKAGAYRSKNALLGIDLDIKGHNALQSTFVFDA